MALGIAARRGVRGHAAVREPGPAHDGDRLCLVLPRRAGAPATPDLVQPGAGLSDHRHSRRVLGQDRRRHDAVRGGPARARHPAGRLHGRGRARRPAVGRSGPVRGGAIDRHAAAADAAPDRHAAGHAGDRAAGRQRVHRHGEADLAGQRHPVHRDPAQRAEHLLRQHPRHRAADRRRHLVSRSSSRSSASCRSSIERYYARGTGRAGRRDERRPARSPHIPTGGREPLVVAVEVVKRFGTSGGAEGHLAAVATGEVRLRHRPVGLGQEHLPALHQPARDASTAAPSGSTASCRLSPRRATSSTNWTTRADRPPAPLASAWCSSASTCSRT